MNEEDHTLHRIRYDYHPSACTCVTCNEKRLFRLEGRPIVSKSSIESKSPIESKSTPIQVPIQGKIHHVERTNPKGFPSTPSKSNSTLWILIITGLLLAIGYILFAVACLQELLPKEFYVLCLDFVEPVLAFFLSS